jgi:hypothetical protein
MRGIVATVAVGILAAAPAAAGQPRSPCSATGHTYVSRQANAVCAKVYRHALRMSAGADSDISVDVRCDPLAGSTRSSCPWKLEIATVVTTGGEQDVGTCSATATAVGRTAIRVRLGSERCDYAAHSAPPAKRSG